MLNQTFRQNTEQNSLIRLVLVFALVLAALHVALHDLDLGDGDPGEYSECQVCRLSHVPIVFLPQPSLLVLQQLSAYLPVAEKTEYQPSLQFHTQWTRAPPRF